MPPPVRRALLSVSDKTGLVELARELARRNIEILSTGGTAQLLAANGLAVGEVASYTGFPEIMGGRRKTLHPKIHGGLLGRRGMDDGVMAQHGIAPIDLLAVNLYPFAATVARPGSRYAEAIENIDVGGPAMLRAAAKNHESVLVVVDPADYPRLLAELDAHQGGSAAETRARLAAKAFAHTARYDAMVAGYLSAEHPEPDQGLPATLQLLLEKAQDLRYGENPHQRAALYREPAALGATVREAYESAYRTDPTSAFGGIIAFNRELDASAAEAILERQFVEVLAAPAVSTEAARVLAGKPNVRLLELGDLNARGGGEFELRSVSGGLLVQSRDVADLSPAELEVPTRRKPSEAELADLIFAWRVCKFVKSNAIVFARAGATIGIGAGQMSRVYSTRLAAMKAADEKLTIAGAVMASDAFLPFRDNLDEIGRASCRERV